MVIDRKYGEIASWWFETNQVSDFNFDLKEVKSLLDLAQGVIDVLHKSQLLTVTEMKFSGWSEYDKDKEKLIRKKKGSKILRFFSTDNQSEISKYSIAFLERTFESDKWLFPLETEIIGFGIIFNELGYPTIHQDIVRLKCMIFNGFVIELLTQSFAWMPFNLQGINQKEIYEQNSPRLENALMLIEQELGVKAVSDPNSDYSIVSGYRLFNRTDIDGDVLNVDPNSNINE